MVVVVVDRWRVREVRRVVGVVECILAVEEADCGSRGNAVCIALAEELDRRVDKTAAGAARRLRVRVLRRKRVGEDSLTVV